MTAHEDCRRVLIDTMAQYGGEVTVSTEPPIIPTPYDPNPMMCPHGVTFYMAPTSEQIMAWAQDGVK